MRKNRKKLRLLALLLAALTLCGCSAAAAVRRPAQPQLQLYYCRKDSGDTKTGVLGTQEVPAQTDPAALLETYLQGPEDEALALPFTPGDTCAVESLQDGVLTLRLELRAAGDIRTSLIYACLTCTMTQLESVQSVAFLRTAQPQPQTDGPYTADDFVLLDASAENPEYAVRLFYPDKNGLLTPVTTVLACTDPGQLPLLALQALIRATVPVNLSRVVPAGTQVMDISVSDGTASVVLSDQFMSCDTSAARAGSAVRSIAATLCDLSGVTAVSLSVIGESGLTYYDISEPITPQPDWFSE